MPQYRKIKIMPEALAIKIAAGEVIERPASVIKELIENSIDAKASDISIYIKDGGRKLIKVVDNGYGMSREDVVTAFLRHATSKVLKEEDLYSINTLGFRGEALPSIAAISETIVHTKIPGEISGTMVKIKGGRIEDITDTGCADGTAIEVRDIFFNTPARLKFMRSVSTETGNISDTVARLAIAYPSIRFRLYNNKTVMLETSAGSNIAAATTFSTPFDGEGRVGENYNYDVLRVRIADVFGKGILRNILFIEAGDSMLQVHGFIARPETSYSTTKGIFIYVNNRWIRDRGINHAVLSGYRNCIMEGRYPFVILFVTIMPQLVDVNVHPTKCEVRFKNPKDVHELINKTITNVLSAPSVPFSELPSSLPHSFLHPVPPPFNSLPLEGRGTGWGMESKEGEGRGKVIREGIVNYEGRQQFNKDVCQNTAFYDDTASYQTGIAELSSEGIKPLFFEVLEVIGQLWLEYILCEKEGEFYIIDQHAAAERIAFENLKKDYFANHYITNQMLLLPQRLEFSMQEKEIVEGSLDAIKALGFDIEPFSGNTFIIRAVPHILSGRDCRCLIKDMIDELVDTGISFKIDDRLDEILMRVACHSVIRGKRQLSREEAKALIKNLAKVDFSLNCPHGRPIIKAISKFEIEKMFKRR